MNKFLHISLLLIPLLSGNVFSEWYSQNSGTGSALNALYFTDINTGYVTGNNGIILKTTNKGLNWLQLNSSTGKNLYSVFFNDANNGYSVGDSVILKTTNAGSTWNSYPMNFPMKSVYFVNSQLGFIASYFGVVIKTTDAGTSWTSMVAYDIAANYTSVYFSDANTGYVVGLSGRYVKTTDGGVSWSQKPVFYQKNYYTVQFPSRKTGYIIGGWINNIIMKSVDEGESFEWQVSGFTGVRLFGSSFLDTSYGIAVGREGSILRTTDAGLSWLDEASGTNSILYGVKYLDQNTAYAVGENGTILSTIQVIGITPINSNVPSAFSLSQNYPNPFNPVTKIRFELPASGQRTAYDTKLIIYDMLGREISVLVNEELKAGTYEIDFNATALSSGTYFYTLFAGSLRETKSMILVK